MAVGGTYLGTSGYAYPAWKGCFYPEKLAQSKFLEYYAERFSTVEINNTFYRFPSQKMLEDWQTRTPEGFTFAVKANQRITHHGRLKDVGQVTQDFIERCAALGDKLGPLLFQLPPNLKRDDDRLGPFLDGLPSGARCALEFRHASWFEDAVFEMLSAANAGLVLSEDEKLVPPRVATSTEFVYVRLRKDHYDDADLDDWRGWFEAQTASGRDVYAYLKHDESGCSPESILDKLRHAP